ncbi:MAG: hypothetical protein J6P03_03400 [Opitutales bacterium]|nr:hypothetical protein [Opitutales bacterium]
MNKRRARAKGKGQAPAPLFDAPGNNALGQWLEQPGNAEKMMAAAQKEAAYIAARAPAGAVDIDDLAGDLILDILRAAHKFDPRRGVREIYFIRSVLALRGRNRLADMARKAERAGRYRDAVQAKNRLKIGME